MKKIYEPGLIFISHASADKEEINDIIKKIPKSHLFYDTDSVNPGKHTIEELDDGLITASVFVMFVSPNTPKSVWVDYESTVAYLQKIKRNHLAILSVPIKGATYHDAPEWMQGYMSVPNGYSNSDIARLIKYLYTEVLKNQQILAPEPFVGREDLCNKIIVQTRTKSAQTGSPINFIILAGIPNMGRFSIAKNIISKIFPGARKDLPVFEIPPQGDAIDLFLALREDITGKLGKEWVESQIKIFPSEPEEQAKLLLYNFEHFSKINMTIVIKSAYGLRNQSRTLKPWVSHLFNLLNNEPNIRIIWISDRLLPPESVEKNLNVLQFHVQELTEEHIIYLLTELLDISKTSPAILTKIAPHVHGHPGSAHYVANLITMSQRSPESLLDKPDSIRSFQQECVQGAISAEAIGELGRDIIRILRVLPTADYELITHVFNEFCAKEIAQTLWDMTDNCIINYNMSLGYRLADIIRGNSTGILDEISSERLQKLCDVLSERLNKSESQLAAIDALIFAFVRLEGNIPKEFFNILTGGTLQEIVEQYYNLGHSGSEKWAEHFRTAAKISMLASKIPMSSDTLESILFSGADSLIRIGDDPTSILNEMQAKKFPSVNYLLGSLSYHRKKNPTAAIPFLQTALEARSYIKRTGRLLAKCYMEVGLPEAGLEVFQKLGDQRVNQDAGLLAQKIKCLRACGKNDEANKLVIMMKNLENEFGEYEILSAAKSMNDGKYDVALKFVEAASLKPKVNRINLKLLETAIKIEKGDFSDLESTCKLAMAIGLENGAYSLQARAAISQKNWYDAERHLAKILHKNYYDKLLLARAFHIKLSDSEVLADPETYNELREEYESLLIDLKKGGVGEWLYDTH